MVTELSDAMSEESLATKADITRLERELSVVKWMTSAAAQCMRRLRRTIDQVLSVQEAPVMPDVIRHPVRRVRQTDKYESNGNVG